MAKYKAMAVFGSASDDIDPVFRPFAFETGALLARNGITMIYGVGDGGLMGESFRGARSEKGRVLGITIPTLLKRQCADTSIYQKGELKVVKTLHDRKRLMMEKASALLIAPGGLGTLDEVASFGVHVKIGDRAVRPVIFLNFNGFWNPMKKMLKQMLQYGVIQAPQIEFVDYADTPDEIFNALARVEKRLKK